MLAALKKPLERVAEGIGAVAVALALGGCASLAASDAYAYRRQLITDVAEVCAKPFTQEDHWRIPRNSSPFGRAQLASPNVQVVFVDSFYGQPVAHFTPDEWRWVQMALQTPNSYLCVEQLTVLFLAKFDPPPVSHVSSPYEEACLYAEIEVAIMGCRAAEYHNHVFMSEGVVQEFPWRTESDTCYTDKAKAMQKVIDACGTSDTKGSMFASPACTSRQTELVQIRLKDCNRP